MTEQALAVVQPTSIVPNAQNLRLLATDMFNSKMFRGVETPAQAVAIIQMGSELGFGPVTSLNIIKIIQGQMTVAARGLLALAADKAGVSWQTLESTDKKCAIKFSRPKWDDMEVSFTIEEAKAAGLLRAGGGWEKYPKDMLFARCASRGVRRIAPDAISGLYATEEIQDAAPFYPGEAVVVDDEELRKGGQATAQVSGNAIEDSRQGDRPRGAQVKGAEPTTGGPGPSPAQPSPANQEAAWRGMVDLTLSDGTVRSTPYFQALQFFQAVKRVVGDADYYEVLERGGAALDEKDGKPHFRTVPKERVAQIFAILVDVAKRKKEAQS